LFNPGQDGKGKAYTVYEVSVGRTTWAAAKRYSAFHALMQVRLERLSTVHNGPARFRAV
jgi:hypothetical protein